MSIGTGQHEPRPFGDDPRQIVKTLIKTATETEATERRFSENHIVNGLQGQYFRFNVDRGLEKVKLDDVGKLDTVQTTTELYLGGDRVQRQIKLFVISKMRRDGNTILVNSCFKTCTNEIKLTRLGHRDEEG